MSASTAAVPAGRSYLRNELWPLYRRNLRVWLRVPSAVVPPLFIPIFFLIVNSSALEGITELPVFNDVDYVSFIIPVSLLMTVAAAGSGSGLALVQDIDTGYFDKMLLAPIRRSSILLSKFMMDATRAALQAILVIVVGILWGGSIATGIGGALLLVAMAFMFGLAYSGISINIALRTGSPEATQASFVIFFPLVFLAPTFVPLEFLADWLEVVARFNPVAYVIIGMRALTTEGYVAGDLLGAFAAIGGLGIITMGGAFRALAARASQ